MRRFLFSGLLLAALVVAPAANAVTIEELQAQINSLLQQIEELKKEENRSSTSGSGTAGGNNTNTGSNTNACFTKDLHFGIYDAEVIKLQEFLRSHGLFNGPASGYFGSQTQAAVQQFQAHRNIFSNDGRFTGYFGPATRAVVNQMIGCSGTATPPPPPTSGSVTVDMKANGSNGPLTVASGSDVVLSWTSTGANYCSGFYNSSNNDLAHMSWIASQGISGKFTTGPITQETTFTLVCSLGNNTASDSVILKPDSSLTSTPTVTLTANPIYITPGQRSTLTVNTANFASGTTVGCPLSGGISAPGNLPNTYVVTPTVTTTYRINCSNSAGQSASASATVTVNQPTDTSSQAPVINSFTASPDKTLSGGYSVLSWNTSNVGFSGTCTLKDQSGRSYADSTGKIYYSGSHQVYPTQTSTYNITCKNSAGETASRSVTVVVDPKYGLNLDDLKVSMSASPSIISPGQSSTLTWSSQNAARCIDVADGRTSGSRTVSPLNTTTYVVTCYNDELFGFYGKTAYATVTVNQPGTPVTASAPSVYMTANPSTITAGQSSTLTVNAGNASYCTDPRGTSNNHYMWPMQVSVTPSQTTTYSVTCYNSSGQSASVSATLTVSQAPTSTPAPTVSVTASPDSITPGQSTTISWSSSNTTSCKLWDGSSAGISGSKTFSPSATATYSITCSNSSGQSASASATIYVTGMEGGAPIANTYSALYELLKQLSKALGN